MEQKIAEVFDLFDHERNKTIDFRELGTVIRALGRVPTEKEVVSLVRELENDPPNGYINYERFLPAILEAMDQNKYPPASEDDLLKAFATLDPENKGYLEASKLEALMGSEGETFTAEELEEMLAAATDLSKGRVLYHEYVVLLTTFDEEEP